MSNMSYCRFENTYKDLADCAEHIYDVGLSESEIKYRRKLAEMCSLIANNISADYVEEGEDEDE